MPTRIIATSLALVAFAAAVIGGLIADNPAHTILLRAMFAMILCHVVGSVIGLIAQRAVEEHIEQYKKEHPLMSVEELSAALQLERNGGADAPTGAGDSAVKN